MRFLKNFTLLAVSGLVFLGCQHRYFILEKADFSPNSVGSSGMKQFDNVDFRMYKFYFCKTEESHEGIKFESYNPCEPFLKKDDRLAIQRVVSLIFIDDERVIYATSDGDWPEIPNAQIHLDKPNNRIKEGYRLAGKYPMTYFRGYYFLNNGELTISLDEGAEVKPWQVGKLNRLRSKESLENDPKKNSKLRKCASAARSNMTWLHFETDATFSSLKLLRIEYHDDDYGVDFNRPVEKNMDDIFSTEVYFNLNEPLSDSLQLMLKNQPVHEIGFKEPFSQTCRFYKNANGELILEENSVQRSHVLTW